MNFNLPLRLFEDQIAGVRKLVDICALADHTVKLFVTSSIGVANGWDPVNGPVPEQPLPDPTSANSTGYTSSKYVTEQVRLLIRVSAHGRLKVQRASRFCTQLRLEA